MKIVSDTGPIIGLAKIGRIITIPRANPLDAFTMGGIIKDAGLTLDEFKKLVGRY